MTSAVYTRTDVRGGFPRREGAPDIAANRLAVFWRPLLDLRDSPFTAVRLRAVPVVNAWLRAPERAPRSPFSLIGVPGQRGQVARHAGLDAYGCREPAALAPHLRPPGWQTLVDAIDAFPGLDDHARGLVVFHLAQLSFCDVALRLAGDVRPTGDVTHDWYVLDVGRVLARTGRFDRALPLFAALTESPDPVLATTAVFQWIGHSLRTSGPDAHRFLDLGLARARQVADPLVVSHFSRAVAMLLLRDGDLGGARRHAGLALSFHEAIAPGLPRDENDRCLAELALRIAMRAGDPSEIVACCDRLARADPYCVDVRLQLGAGHAAAGDLRSAAHWFSRAGELGTGAGAVGWFRAAHCFAAAGDPAAAANAMGRCLELDTSAREPRHHLAEALDPAHTSG
ncbi:tetratricopeptide repeat protein [Actinoplanes sp. RD1]|uniref:tetratricopeptide repeat protein n=1 Tax=Actinoplanes sp. RD1 TaxID=3064538 RepID=UPI0027418311|nr:hypothetical protein [Actinoplanes sp. RD1]